MATPTLRFWTYIVILPPSVRFSTYNRRLLVHYFSLFVLLMYSLVFYGVVISCYKRFRSLSVLDAMVHQIVPYLVIMLFSVSPFDFFVGTAQEGQSNVLIASKSLSHLSRSWAKTHGNECTHLRSLKSFRQVKEKRTFLLRSTKKTKKCRLFPRNRIKTRRMNLDERQSKVNYFTGE